MSVDSISVMVVLPTASPIFDLEKIVNKILVRAISL